MSNNIEQYLTIFVHSMQYLIISGNIYQYLTISNNIEQDSKLFCTPYDIIQYLKMSNNIEQYLTIFVHSKQSLIISGNIYQYLTISNNIKQDSKLFCTPYDIIQFWNFFLLLFYFFLHERVLKISVVIQSLPIAKLMFFSSFA